MPGFARATAELTTIAPYFFGGTGILCILAGLISSFKYGSIWNAIPGVVVGALCIAAAINGQRIVEMFATVFAAGVFGFIVVIGLVVIAVIKYL